MTSGTGFQRGPCRELCQVPRCRDPLFSSSRGLSFFCFLLLVAHDESSRCARLCTYCAAVTVLLLRTVLSTADCARLCRLTHLYAFVLSRLYASCLYIRARASLVSPACSTSSITLLLLAGLGSLVSSRLQSVVHFSWTCTSTSSSCTSSSSLVYSDLSFSAEISSHSIRTRRPSRHSSPRVHLLRLSLSLP